MAKIHDKFVIELAEVIKGYGNDPGVDDPFHMSEFYRFYELPEIAVSANHFKTMIPLEVEKAKGRKTGRWIDAIIPNDNGGLPVQVCDQCNTFFPLAYTGGGHSFCPHCGSDMRGVKK